MGFISLGTPGTAPTDLGGHFGSPKVSGLPVDALLGGEVSVLQTEEAVVVTYDDVPTKGATPVPGNLNDFQIELFFDGTIRVSYVDADPDASGVIGLSFGNGDGVNPPDGFVESDLTNANTKALGAAL